MVTDLETPSATEKFSIFQFFEEVTKTHCMHLKVLYNKHRHIKPRQKYEIVCTSCPLSGCGYLSSMPSGHFSHQGKAVDNCLHMSNQYKS